MTTQTTILIILFNYCLKFSMKAIKIKGESNLPNRMLSPVLMLILREDVLPNV